MPYSENVNEQNCFMQNFYDQVEIDEDSESGSNDDDEGSNSEENEGSSAYNELD